MRPTVRRTLRRTLLSSLAGALAGVLFFPLFGVNGWEAFHSTHESGGDVYFASAVIRALVLGEWLPFGLPRSEHLGAPFGMTMADFPLSDSLHFTWIKLLSLFTSDAIYLYNLYYWLGFVLAAVTMTWVLLRRRTRSSLAIGAGVLYAFLPYHYFRYGHLLLASYYVLPLAADFLLRIPRGGGPQLGSRKNWIQFALLALALGSSGVYFAFFFVFLFSAVGLRAAWANRSRTVLISAMIAASLITGVTALNLAPSMIARIQHGKNTMVAGRSPREADQYGLRLAHVLLPQPSHRVASFSEMRNRYDRTPIGVEGREEYLGLYSVAGVALLLVIFLFAPFRKSSSLHWLGFAAGVLLLLAVSGGMGAIFNTFVTAKIRCYNRASIVLATFAILAATLLLDRTLRRLPRGLGAGLAVLIAALGLLDQVSPAMGLPWNLGADDARSDRAFIGRIESSLPEGAWVLQLPFMAFPEAPFVGQMAGYSHFRAFLHSQRETRWSYGSVRGRPGDAEIESASTLPLELDRVRKLGYAGLFIDRAGFQDHGVAIESALARKLGIKPLVSENQRLSFFSVR